MRAPTIKDTERIPCRRERNQRMHFEFEASALRQAMFEKLSRKHRRLLDAIYDRTDALMYRHPRAINQHRRRV